MFNAWRRHGDARLAQEAQQYDISLQCALVSAHAHLYVKSKQLKILLQQAKQKALHEKLLDITSSTPAAEVLRSLCSFTGPTNPKKAKKRQLPFVRDSEGTVCSSPTSALNTWTQFFQNMEGGTRMTMQRLRSIWTEEIARFQQKTYDGKLDNFPTLTDLELALRRIPRGKARGPGGIPGELCHWHPAAIARLLYPQLLKIMIHGHEPLAFKGGRLTAVYKGRGPTDQCSSYRSLLISNHLGKAIHRTLRVHHAQIYETFLQAQQTGGRRHVPVQLPLHQARAFVRYARSCNQSSAVLYLDLKEAFYRIVREAPLGGEVSDDFVAFLAKRLNLPFDALHQIHLLLGETAALQSAGLPDDAQRSFRAIHASTHFWMDGQDDISRTTIGTRPGDCMADIVFGYAWACVLHKLQAHMEHDESLCHFAVHDHLPMFGHFPGRAETSPFLGSTWMDDLAVCVVAQTPEMLLQKVTTVAGQLLDLCEFHCMQPNLERGKTELMLMFRGARSRQHRIKFYGPNATKNVPIVRENGVSHIQLVSRYKHLGCVLHHTGDQTAEIQQKAAQGHAAFNQHRKILYQNPHVSLEKRAELFQMLVLSKFLYGAETWIAMDARTMKKFHANVMRLYKRLLPTVDVHEHITDEEVLARVGLLSPLELLHRARLRYFTTLVHCQLTDIWGIFATDHHWISMLENAMIWMWEQLQRSSSLPDPRTSYMTWLQLIQNSPKYWKRLLRRACGHCMKQREKRVQVQNFHQEVLERFETACRDIPDLPPSDYENEEDATHTFGCMQCHVKCRSRAGEAAHMFKRHGQVSRLRRLFSQPTCAACMKHFHTNAKMKAHLYYSESCRQWLESSNIVCTIVPGTGSQEDRAREVAHDRVLPPLQEHGPRLASPRMREVIEYNETIYDFLVNEITERPDPIDFRMRAKDCISATAVSWTELSSTLQFLLETTDNQDADIFGFDITRFRDYIREIMDVRFWDFLQVTKPQKGELKNIEMYERRCKELQCHIQQHGYERIPRQFGKHRVLLHAYSGRRRIGDLQYYVDLLTAQRTAYIVHVVSLDIVVDATWGDASNPTTRAYWIGAVRARYVMAFVGGPPCETWSRARG